MKIELTTTRDIIDRTINSAFELAEIAGQNPDINARTKALHEAEKNDHREFAGGVYDYDASNSTITIELNDDAVIATGIWAMKVARRCKPLIALVTGIIPSIKQLGVDIKREAKEFSEDFKARFGRAKTHYIVSAMNVDMDYVMTAHVVDDGFGNFDVPHHYFSGTDYGFEFFRQLAIRLAKDETCKFRSVYVENEAFDKDTFEKEYKRVWDATWADFDGSKKTKASDNPQKLKMVNHDDKDIIAESDDNDGDSYTGPLGKVCGNARMIDYGEGRFAVISATTDEYDYVAIVNIDEERTIATHITGDLNRAEAAMLMAVLNIRSVMDNGCQFFDSHRAAEKEFNRRMNKKD